MTYRATPHRASGETSIFLMFSRDIRTKLPSLDLLQEQITEEVKRHHQMYKEKMKDYADKTNRAKDHSFKVGDVVYVANMEQGKLDSKFKSAKYVLLSKTSDSSYELVNTEDGSLIKRNVKHMRHASLSVDSPVPELERRGLAHICKVNKCKVSKSRKTSIKEEKLPETVPVEKPLMTSLLARITPQP